MASCNVTGTLMKTSSLALSGATVSFNVTKPTLDAALNLVMPVAVSTISAANGTWTLPITQGVSGVISFSYQIDSTAQTTNTYFSITVPVASSATFASLLVAET